MVYRSDVPGVILNHSVSEEVAILANELDITLKSLGAERYAYFHSSVSDSGPKIITNLPEEWLSEYEEDHLYDVDPVLDISRHTMLPFCWVTQGINRADNVRLAANALKYKILQGHTFVSVSHGHDIGVLTICNEEEEAQAVSDSESQKAAIQFALLAHHDRYGNLEKIVEDHPFEKLSWREREVLTWVGYGKTYSEAALILGISERTIKFHMSNIKQKLEVSSSRQAISIATKYGLLNVP